MVQHLQPFITTTDRHIQPMFKKNNNTILAYFSIYDPSIPDPRFVSHITDSTMKLLLGYISGILVQKKSF